MKNKKLSIRELSILTDISEPTLKNLRTKNTNPTLDVLRKLSSSLDVTVNELLGEETISIFNYSDEIDIAKIIESKHDSFMILFASEAFEFKVGTKALFKLYDSSFDVTKYIIHKNGKLLESIDADKMLFSDDRADVYSIKETDIFACIQKIIYEVNYV